MTKITFIPYETADYLKAEEASFEEGDSALFLAGLGDNAKARNMSKLAREVKMSREGLYKAL